MLEERCEFDGLVGLPSLLGGSHGGLRALSSFPWHTLFLWVCKGRVKLLKEEPPLAGDSFGNGIAGISPQLLFGGCFS